MTRRRGIPRIGDRGECARPIVTEIVSWLLSSVPVLACHSTMVAVWCKSLYLLLVSSSVATVRCFIKDRIASLKSGASLLRGRHFISAAAAESTASSRPISRKLMGLRRTPWRFTGVVAVNAIVH